MENNNGFVGATMRNERMTPSAKTTDPTRAERIKERMTNAPLGTLVEMITAVSWCLRDFADGKRPSRDVLKVANELIDWIDDGQASNPDVTDATRRPIEVYVGCLQLDTVADLMDEYAESLRAVLLYDDPSRLERFHRGLRIDVALANNPAIADLVARDRAGELVFEAYGPDQELSESGALIGA